MKTIRITVAVLGAFIFAGLLGEVSKSYQRNPSTFSRWGK